MHLFPRCYKLLFSSFQGLCSSFPRLLRLDVDSAAFQTRQWGGKCNPPETLGPQLLSAFIMGYAGGCPSIFILPTLDEKAELARGSGTAEGPLERKKGRLSHLWPSADARLPRGCLKKISDMQTRSASLPCQETKVRRPFPAFQDLGSARLPIVPGGGQLGLLSFPPNS